MAGVIKKIIAVIVVIAIFVGTSFSVIICTKKPHGPSASESDGGSSSGNSTSDSSGDQSGDDDDGYPAEIFRAGVYNPVKTEYVAEYLGTTERKIPEVSNGGLERYPEYGVTLSGATEDEKNAIIAENDQLRASSTTYDAMDADGNLYLNGEATGKKLYKHTASAGMYEGDVADDEPAIIKRITMQARPAGNHITGLYAPAGEVVKFEISAEDLAATGGIIVHIGQLLQNGQANNIWAKRDFNRMPNILNTMTMTAETSYAGSYLGGPIYIQPVNAGVKFTVTVSGAVPYSHYIHGYTTEDEFERNRNSSAPYFDLEVWDDSVRHSGPKARVERLGYEQLTEAAVLWDKISRVSNQVPSGSNAAIGITFLYDPFVAAGSLVAFVGRSTVNCPLHCMYAALDVESAVNNASDNFWGCIHEYNHHYQRYGFAPGDEVTNNAVSLVSYSLFTRISSRRKIGNADEGSYAVGWDRYTNPSWVLRQTLGNSEVNSGLDSYANLLHAFGQTRFLQAAKNGNGSGGADTWYKAVSDATNYDMTYYFKEILHQTISDDVAEQYAEKNYPAFVPVASIYQTGRSYVADGGKYYSRTAQPYEIDPDKEFELDFNENIVIPEGFTVTIKNITKPQYGTLVKKSDGVYVYTPDAVSRESGKMYVTLGITKDDGAFTVDDVDLVVELKRRNVLERTVYTYAASAMYKNPTEAYSNGYAGYETITEENNDNPTQNANTDMWVPTPSKNAVMEIRGKFFASADGRYRLAIRGRQYAALYVSTDGKNYELAANMVNLTNSPQFDLSNENNYKDYDFKKGQCVYFKEVLLVLNDRSFVGLGLGKFDGETVTVNYLDAYRNAYDKDDFKSDYYYERNYSYDYSEVGGKQTLVETNYNPWGKDKPINLLFDDDDTNWIHSGKADISEENPFELTADLGKVTRVNRFTIYGEPSRRYQPKDFKLYGGTELDDLKLIAEVNNSERVNDNVVVDFDTTDIRYYKLVVTDTWAIGQTYRYIAFRCAKFSYSIDGGTRLSPDEPVFVYRGNWSLSNKFASFGHLYEGENATLEFEFTGNRFAIFSYSSLDYDGFEVLIDGALADTVEISGDADNTELVYLSDELSAGTHKITIRSKSKFNVDSIVLWK